MGKKRRKREGGGKEGSCQCTWRTVGAARPGQPCGGQANKQLIEPEGAPCPLVFLPLGPWGVGHTLGLTFLSPGPLLGQWGGAFSHTLLSATAPTALPLSLVRACPAVLAAGGVTQQTHGPGQPDPCRFAHWRMLGQASVENTPGGPTGGGHQLPRGCGGPSPSDLHPFLLDGCLLHRWGFQSLLFWHQSLCSPEGEHSSPA